jgi:hypothetical protein
MATFSPVVVCVEGTKGAGKTSTIASARALLEAEGWAVTPHAVFHEGNAWAVEQGFSGGVPMIEAGAEENRAMVAWLVARIRSFRADFLARHRDAGQPALLLADRGWVTLHAYLHDGRWASEPGASGALEAIEAQWQEILREAPPTFFIHTRPELSARRRAGQLDAVSGLQSDERLTRDYTRRMRLAREHGDRLAASWETGDGPFVDLGPAMAEIVRRMSAPR